jgi:hypothetical protein
MKKLLFLAILALAFAACEKTEIENPKGKFDPEAMITIRGKFSNALSPMQKAKFYGLSPLDVVEQSRNLKWTTNWAGNWYTERPEYVSRVVSEDLQKDYNLPAIKMFSTDVIDWLPVPGVYLIKDFIYGRDVVITDSNNDTIAFVPDSLIINARDKIEIAFNDSNYTEVYRLFNEAFTFYPFSK